MVDASAMHRLFVALRPPPPIRALLRATMAGVPDARWQDDEQLHVTLRFIGEVETPAAEAIAEALARVVAPALTVRLDGVGRFESRGRVTALWAGLAPRHPLAALFRKIDRAVSTAGQPPERRAYLPHVTLARFPARGGSEAGIARWLADHAVLASPAFTLDQLILYESCLGHGGASYAPAARWPLTG